MAKKPEFTEAIKDLADFKKSRTFAETTTINNAIALLNEVLVNGHGGATPLYGWYSDNKSLIKQVRNELEREISE